MCGRFTLHHSADELAARFDAQPTLPDIEPRYNIAPSQPLAAVIQATPDGPRQIEALHWGLIPFWAKDPAIGNRMINARAETLAEKPAFRHALTRRRCLIPADGFYEWRKEGGKSQPFHIRISTGDLFAFAGLWETWKRPDDGQTLRSCTIITVPANPLMAPIHDRMPAILRPHDEARWLDTAHLRDPNDLLDLLGPYEDDVMEAYAVSKLVNAPVNDDPACIEPLPAAEQNGAAARAEAIPAGEQHVQNSR